MNYQIIPNEELVDSYIFKCAILQCGTTEEEWMRDNRLMDMVAMRIGELKRRYDGLSDVQKASGFEALEKYLSANGRL